jgi:hypothetical protein
MVQRIAILAVIVAPAFAAACGGGQPEAAAPANATSASASAPAAASAAPAAGSAAPGASEAPAASASASPSAAPAAAGPAGAPAPGDWDKWSKDQKMAYMKSAVMPKMGGMLHDFDAKMFAEPRCTTCHGEGAKKGDFKMPNAKLPKLPGTPEGFKELKDKKPKVVDFMIDVEKTVAGLIGEQPFDPQTKQGFGCFNCHTKKEK